MTFRSLVFIALGLLALVSAVTRAGDPNKAPQFDVADQYLALYLKGNISALSPWMDTDIHFFDSASDFKGKQATLKGLTDVFKSVRMGRFSETHRQRDGELATYQGTLAFQMDGAALGAPGKWYHFDIPFSVVLRMNGDKVIEHQDLVDTNALNAQFRAQYFATPQHTQG